MDIEYLSCMAHAWAKFKYAQEQGSDSRADKSIDLIGRLYAFEEDYKRDKLSPEKIKEKRHFRETMMIMASLREYLDATIKEMKEEEDSLKSLMWKAVTYFDHYWKQLFAYRMMAGIPSTTALPNDAYDRLPANVMLVCSMEVMRGQTCCGVRIWQMPVCISF